MKRRVNIEVCDDLDPFLAVNYVAQVMQRGRESVDAGVPIYCWHVSFNDGVEVSTRRHDKRRPNSDGFVVYKRKVGAA